MGLVTPRRLRRIRKRALKKIKLMYFGVMGPVPTPEKWVFIVGCYNSGTTLLHKLLASLPQCGSMPTEGQYCTTELLIPKAVGLRRLWALQPERFRLDERSQVDIDLERLKRQWGGHFNDPGRPILLEKSPVNAARMRWLQRHFENAHFIAVVRNGFAVAEGIRRKAGYPVEMAARQWVRCNEIMLSDLECIRQKRIVRYEELTESPERVMGDILEFLGIDGSCAVGDRTWKVHSERSQIRNMNQRSFAALTCEERESIQEVARGMLERFQYACR